MKVLFVDILTEKDDPNETTACRVGVQVEHNGQRMSFVCDASNEEAQATDYVDKKIGAATVAVKKCIQAALDACAS